MYLKFIMFILSGLLLSEPARAGICDPSVLGAADGVPGKRFTLRIPPLSASLGSAAWINHSRFLTALGIVPAELELTASEEMLSTGQYKTAALFLESFDALTQNSAGNLLLRFLGSRAKLIANEVGRPELAGDLLVALLNISPLRFQERGDDLAVRPLSAAHMFQKMGFDIYPGLFDLAETLGWGEAATNRATLPLLWLSMTNMMGMLSGQHAPYHIARLNAQGALASMGGMYDASDLEFPIHRPGSRHTTVEVNFGPNNPYELAFDIYQQTPGPQFLIPSSGETLRLLALPWSLTITLKGSEIAGFVPLSTSVAERMQNDIWLFERLMYPLLLETQAYSKARAAKDFAGVPVAQDGDYLPLPTIDADLSALDSMQLRDQAIGYAMAATLRLYRQDRRIFGLQNLFNLLLRRDTHKQLTYASFERIARKTRLPIHLLAYNRLPPQQIRAYPNFPVFEGRRNPPPRHLLISIVTEEQAHYNQSLAGVTPETNLELLEHSTGVLRAFDVLTN